MYWVNGSDRFHSDDLDTLKRMLPPPHLNVSRSSWDDTQECLSAFYTSPHRLRFQGSSVSERGWTEHVCMFNVFGSQEVHMWENVEIHYTVWSPSVRHSLQSSNTAAAAEDVQTHHAFNDWIIKGLMRLGSRLIQTGLKWLQTKAEMVKFFFSSVHYVLKPT